MTFWLSTTGDDNHWDVMSGDRKVGSAWRGTHDPYVTVHVPSITVTDAELGEALRRLQRHFGEAPDAEPNPGRAFAALTGGEPDPILEEAKTERAETP